MSDVDAELSCGKNMSKMIWFGDVCLTWVIF